jgi:hypothetical protein
MAPCAYRENVVASAPAMRRIADFVAAGLYSLNKTVCGCVAYTVFRDVFPDFNQVISG